MAELQQLPDLVRLDYNDDQSVDGFISDKNAEAETAGTNVRLVKFVQKSCFIPLVSPAVAEAWDGLTYEQQSAIVETYKTTGLPVEEVPD